MNAGPPAFPLGALHLVDVVASSYLGGRHVATQPNPPALQRTNLARRSARCGCLNLTLTWNDRQVDKRSADRALVDRCCQAGTPRTEVTQTAETR